MSTDQPEPKIELEVQNFGPIAEAKIDLRPLTVFVGPSNTGKSYLAILIYVLQRWLSERMDDSRDKGSKSLPREKGSKHFTEMSSDAISQVADELWAFVETVASHKNSDLPITAPKKLATLISADISALNWHCEMLDEEFARCFAVETIDDLTRHSSDTAAHISVESSLVGSHNGTALFSLQLELGDIQKFRASLSEDRDIPIPDGPERQEWVDAMRSAKWYIDHDADPYESYQTLVSVLRSLGIEHLAGLLEGLSHSVHYLPADRSGLIRGLRALVSGLVNLSARRGGNGDQGHALLSGILADFVQTVSSIDDHPRGRNARLIGPLAGSLEAAVLQGAIRVDTTSLGDPMFSYQPQGWVERLSILGVSSMVAELAPVVLYIRNLVGVGDTLIIEEPEAHLHPAAQAELAIVLALLVKQGVRVIVTTHSSWIVDQFANLIKLGELEPDERADFTGGHAALSREDVGAWTFEDRGTERGSLVTEMRYDPDGVGFDPGYLGIANQQYNVWADVTNRIANKKLR